MQAFDLDKNKNCFLYKRRQVRWSIRSFDFAEEGRFYRFQIFLEGGEGNERVRIYVNDGRDDQLLAISSYRRTSTNCRSLGTKRSTLDERGNPDGLAEYEVTVEAPPPPPPAGPEATEFNIELVFMDEGVFDAREEGWIRDAADRWEKIITGDIEDHSFCRQPSNL